MLCDSRDFVFNADREEMLKIMKYNADMVKEEKEPTIFHSENGKLYTYLQTSRYQTFDKIETKNLVMDGLIYWIQFTLSCGCIISY